MSTTASGPASSTVPTASPWLLSLGDSLGFGLQEERFVTSLTAGYQASDFGGYVAPLTAALRRRAGAGGLTVVNYACPGETTASMLRGHCPIPSALLHDPFTGPQQQAALAWLAAHRREPGVIVVSIGANDLLPVISCRPQPQCGRERLTSTRTTLLSHLTTIVAQLRAAAPQARLLYLAPYNPYVVTAPASQQVANLAAPGVSAAAKSAGATVVDGYAVIDGSRAATTSAISSAERSRVCRLTLFCQPSHRDLHPSDAGYAALAQALEAAVPTSWP
ncbi:MAG: SGNH/GDSL hydrolase family protein [Actinomycetales bacterium]